MSTQSPFNFPLLINPLSILIVALLISLNAYSSTSTKALSGTITFTGNIVNAPCLMSHNQPLNLRIGCLDEQKNMKTEQIDIGKLMGSDKATNLSHRLGSYEFTWLDKRSKAGLIKIKYQ